VNDDGLQIIDEDERRARIEFYADHSIGWVARPKHGDNFTRRGKCKSFFDLFLVARLLTILLVKKVSSLLFNWILNVIEEIYGHVWIMRIAPAVAPTFLTTSFSMA
jgi:hypothetical protein